jgi:hypothetical protein
MKRILLIPFCLLYLHITGCSMIAVTAGATATTVNAAQVMDYAKVFTDFLSLGVSNKTVNDHIISHITGYDCKTINIFLPDKPYCEIDYDNFDMEEPLTVLPNGELWQLDSQFESK